MDNEYLVISLVISAGLGLIPASIAKRKGYSFGVWWFYGWMLFIVAIIHAGFLKDKNVQQAQNYQDRPILYSPSSNAGQNVAEELRKYKELMDEGVISQEEFQAKKEQLLRLR